MAKKRFQDMDKSVTEVVEIIEEVKEPVNQVLVSFDAWFASLKTRRPHHKEAMRKYANTEGKRTVEYWQKLFEKY